MTAIMHYQQQGGSFIISFILIFHSGNHLGFKLPEPVANDSGFLPLFVMTTAETDRKHKER